MKENQCDARLKHSQHYQNITLRQIIKYCLTKQLQ